MSKKLPLVSVITPVYNRANLVGKTIESVLRQDYQNIEYIILDDGSIDESRKVIQKYKKSNRSRKKIIIKTHPNMGETRTVNKGFKIANGEYIGIVNSDDPLLPGAIKEVVKFFHSHPRIIVAYPDWKMIDEKGRLIRKVITQNYNFVKMVKTFYCVPGPGTFFKKTIVDKLKGRDERFRYVGDYDFWLRAGLLGPFGRIPKTLATFRVHKDSASVGSRGLRMAKEHVDLIKKIYNLPNLPEDILKIRQEAFGSAYFVAWQMCGDGYHFQKNIYYLQCLIYRLSYFPRYVKIVKKIISKFFR